MRWLWMIIFTVTLNLGLPSTGRSADFVVYSIYRGLDLGNPGEIPQKDYYINMGSTQGIRDGMILNVHRRISTYDLLSEKLYRDVTFPIARLKVIHTEGTAAIARLDKMLPVEKAPSVNPFAVVVGDIVRVAE
ncbi:MAG: hypothetical protein A2428_06465 [Bdellovibrionales bacterium RIFOXYC1_FULL_54_43]|nr:MAG: hypothetical protein A2428_06465 [Bdellovibrionales bacterium RIFOXYC1_FULL_54_43]